MGKHLVFLCSLFVLLVSCRENISVDKRLDKNPSIWPDYTAVTVPPNIAPLNFKLNDKHIAAQVIFKGKGKSWKVKEKSGQFTFPQKEWQKLLTETAGDKIEVTVLMKSDGKWISFRPFYIMVAKEPIDTHLAYRLIEPGYELWGEMGIYQRELESYKENAIYENKMTQQNCVNCHSFCMQNPDKMLFHMREMFPCTMIIDGDKVEKLNTKTDNTISSLVYPSWHPSGKYVAFSVNTTKQAFHTNHKNRIEVFDLASDVVIYDVEKQEIITSAPLFSTNKFETFPTFSPDGKTLFFCTADAYLMPESYENVKYSLCSIAFNPENRSFGHTVDTLYNARLEGKSLSFPRVSPDGNYLLCTLSGFGNFSIWHKDADLYMINLKTNEAKCLDTVNSKDVESYHSWSSNSRWIVFSSRRIDGLYTRPYFAYVDEKGEVGRPFLLPQKDVRFYHRSMKSYNIPEFITGPVSKKGYKIARKAKKNPGITIKSTIIK